MLLPLKLICDPKKARRDGTSLVYIHSKIAYLFEQVNSEKHYELAFEHYIEAARYFSLSNNVQDSVISELNSANASMYCSNGPTTFEDMLGNVNLINFTKNQYQIASSYDSAKRSTQRLFILLTAKDYIHGKNHTVKYHAEILLGNYFYNLGDYSLAKVFYKLALTDEIIAAHHTSNNLHYDFFQVANTLEKLATIYSLLGDGHEMLKYIQPKFCN